MVRVSSPVCPPPQANHPHLPWHSGNQATDTWPNLAAQHDTRVRFVTSTPGTKTPVVTPGFKVVQFPIPKYLPSRLRPSFFSQFGLAGNLAYSTSDEGLKAFFAPVHGDMLV